MANWAGFRRLLSVSLLAIVAVFVFAACSDDDDDGGNGGSTDTPAANGDGTDAPTDAPSGDGDADGNADGLDVEISGFAFDPGDYTVSAGETVTFNVTNNDGVTHNMHIAPNIVEAGDMSLGEYTESLCDGSADPCSDPAAISGGDSAALEWTAPSETGSVQFRCDFHPTTMIGVITVE